MGDNGQPKINYKISIYVPSEQITAKQYFGMWDPRRRKKKVKHKYQKQLCQNYSNAVKITGYIVSAPRVYSCAMDDLNIIKFRE